MILIIAVVIIVLLIVTLLVFALKPAYLVDHEKLKALAERQWDCTPVSWVVPPSIEDQVFSGHATFSCEFDAIARVGLAGLESYLSTTIPQVATKTHAVTATDSGKSMDVEVENSHKGRKGSARALIVLKRVSAGVLSITSQVDPTKTTGAGTYIKLAGSESIITTMPSGGRYRLTYRLEASIRKPVKLITDRYFKRLVTRRIENELTDNQEEIVTALANHL